MKYRETVEPNSANVVLLTPQGTEHPYYADYGWVGALRAHPAIVGEIWMLGALRSEQHDIGAIGLDRLPILHQHEIVDSSALQRDGTL